MEKKKGKKEMAVFFRETNGTGHLTLYVRDAPGISNEKKGKQARQRAEPNKRAGPRTKLLSETGIRCARATDHFSSRQAQSSTRKKGKPRGARVSVSLRKLSPGLRETESPVLFFVPRSRLSPSAEADTSYSLGLYRAYNLWVCCLSCLQRGSHGGGDRRQLATSRLVVYFISSLDVMCKCTRTCVLALSCIGLRVL
jgi:hypothetical protein